MRFTGPPCICSWTTISPLQPQAQHMAHSGAGQGFLGWTSNNPVPDTWVFLADMLPIMYLLQHHSRGYLDSVVKQLIFVLSWALTQWQNQGSRAWAWLGTCKGQCQMAGTSSFPQQGLSLPGKGNTGVVFRPLHTSAQMGKYYAKHIQWERAKLVGFVGWLICLFD